MSSDASAAVSAATARINAAWRERRYDDLGQMFAEDMVFTLPGFSGLLQGRDAIVASYREFIERVTLTSYREEQLVVHVGRHGGRKLPLGYGLVSRRCAKPRDRPGCIRVPAPHERGLACDLENDDVRSEESVAVAGLSVTTNAIA